MPSAGLDTIVAPTLSAFRLLAEYLGLVYEEVTAGPNIAVAEVIDAQGGYPKGAFG